MKDNDNESKLFNCVACSRIYHQQKLELQTVRGKGRRRKTAQRRKICNQQSLVPIRIDLFSFFALPLGCGGAHLGRFLSLISFALLFREKETRKD